MLDCPQEDRRGRGRPREFDRGAALDAAIKLFWLKGYAAVSIAELCAVMDISPPSLYAAFGNKAALFLEAARHYEKAFWEQLKKKLFAEADLHAAVANYFQDACDILVSADSPCGRMTSMSAMNLSGAESEVINELAKIHADTMRMFEERMRIAIQARQIPVDTDAPALAGCLTALLEGLTLQARENVFLFSLKAMAAYAPRLLPDARNCSPMPRIARKHPQKRIAALLGSF